MQAILGTLMVAVGLFMTICGRTKSEFIVYRLLVARSRILWGQKVHVFYQVAGVMVVVFGLLIMLGYIPSSN